MSTLVERPDVAKLIARLEDEREELKDCSRMQGEVSALDVFTAQRIANTMYDAMDALSALTREVEEARGVARDLLSGSREELRLEVVRITEPMADAYYQEVAVSTEARRDDIENAAPGSYFEFDLPAAALRDVAQLHERLSRADGEQ